MLGLDGNSAVYRGIFITKIRKDMFGLKQAVAKISDRYVKT